MPYKYAIFKIGAPTPVRTGNLQLRRLALYPIELWARFITYYNTSNNKINQQCRFSSCLLAETGAKFSPWKLFPGAIGFGAVYLAVTQDIGVWYVIVFFKRIHEIYQRIHLFF